MNPLKLRRLLIQIHLYLAGFLAPVFILVAVTGAMYLGGIKGSTTKTPITLPAGTVLNADAPTAEADVKAALEAAGVNVRFEYLRGGGDRFMTRPTTRDYVTFSKGEDGFTQATLESPSLAYKLIELHKGHGPQLYRKYQLLAGIILFLVVIGGLVVGVLAKNYRKPTLISTAIGTVLFFVLAFAL